MSLRTTVFLAISLLSWRCSLSALAGFAAPVVNGTWTLLLRDTSFDGNVGSLQCWALGITEEE